MKLKAMGMDVPISLVGSLDNEGKEPKLYLATDMMEYIVAVADSMTDGAIDSSQLDTEKLKGKYIDLFSHERGKYERMARYNQRVSRIGKRTKTVC